MLAQAAARWSATGLSPAQAAALAQVQFQVAEVGGAYLGLANTAPGVVRIDDDAAGWGWSAGSGHSPLVTGPWNDSRPSLLNPEPRTLNPGFDLLTVVMHELGHVLGYGHGADEHGLMAPVLSAGASRAGGRAEAVEPLGRAEWRMGLDSQRASDSLFADLGDDGLIGAGRLGRWRHDEEDTASPLLESGEDDVTRAEAARSPAREAVQARVPRRSRLERYEREVDDWFGSLSREFAEAGDASPGQDG